MFECFDVLIFNIQYSIFNIQIYEILSYYNYICVITLTVLTTESKIKEVTQEISLSKNICNFFSFEATEMILTSELKINKK